MARAHQPAVPLKVLMLTVPLDLRTLLLSQRAVM